MRERKVIASLVLSLAIHAGGLGTLAIVGTHNGAEGGAVSQLGLPAGFEMAFNSPVVPPKRSEISPPPPPPPEPIKTPEVKQPEPTAELAPEEPVVPLGIEESVEPNKVWKGSKEATENLAPKSEVDQAARSMDPKFGSKGENEQPAASAPAAPSQPSPASSPTPPVPAKPAENTEPVEPEEAAAPAQPEPLQERPLQEQPKQEKEQQLEAQQPERQQPLPQQVQTPVPDEPETKAANAEMEVAKPQPKPLQLAPVQPLTTQDKLTQTLLQQLEEQQLKKLQLEPQKDGTTAGGEKSASSPKEPRQPSPPVKPTSAAAPTPPAAPAGVAKATMQEPDPGKKADEESAAAAIVGSLVYKPGEPLAGQGLKVSTVRPRYGYTTMAVARPRDVIVNVTFGRDGRVIRAVFKDGKGTGFEDVDKPLIEAVYRWTAKGEALTKIPAGKPRMGVTFEIKFLWGLE